MMGKFIIYGLIDPITHQLRYIGVAESLNHSKRWVASVLKEAGVVRSLSQAYANRLAQKSQ